MPLYLVEIKDIDALAEASQDDDRGSFGGWTDLRGVVVVAESEAEARKAARAESSPAGDDWWWEDAAHVSCECIVDDGKTRIVMGNWPTG